MDILSHIRPFVYIIIALIALVSCEKFEGDQTIPSYLKIEDFSLVDNSEVMEGKRTHNFSDVWVYVDDQVLGAYELPAVVPVLASGTHKLTLYAGIKFNSQSGTRGTYPFTAPLIIEDFNFTIDSVLELTPEVMYYDNTDFAWIEEFDFTNPESISLEVTSSSDTVLTEVVRNNSDPLFHRLGSRSGIGFVDANNSVFEVGTNVLEDNGFYFPTGASPVIMEMEFNTTNILLVGMFIRKTGDIIQHAVLVLNPTGGEWRKTYVNFTPTISRNPDAVNFNVFFRADWDGSHEVGTIQLDNIKLLRKQ